MITCLCASDTSEYLSVIARLALSASFVFPLCVFRSSSLSAVNAMLREQLEQAGLANEALSQDIRRLTADWTKAREELEQKESDWRREEEVGQGCLQSRKHFKCRL